MRFLVLADLGLGEGVLEAFDAPWGEVLGRLSPSLSLRLPKEAALPGQDLDIALTIRRPEDFSPEGIIIQLPELAALVGIRRRLEAADGGLSSAAILDILPEPLRAGLRDKTGLGEVPGAAPPPRQGAMAKLDSLLEQVALPEDQRRGGDEENLRLRALGAVDRHLSRQVLAILEDPRWRALESAWRGLEFLRGQLEGSSVALELLDAPKEAFPDVFFDRVFQSEYQREKPQPLAAVLAAYGFDRSQEDRELLEDAARLGSSLSTPVLASIGEAFWGLSQPRLLAALPDLSGRLAGTEYIKWRSFRKSQESTWLFLAANRVLLRGGWGREASAPSSFRWSAAESSPLWGEAAWALAAASGRALESSGPRLAIEKAALDGLPMARQETRRGGSFELPCEVYLGPQKVLDLADVGIVAAKVEKGSSTLLFSDVPSFHRAKRYDQAEVTRASELASTLPQRVFAALVTHRIDRLARQVSSLSLSEERLLETFRQELLPFVDGEADIEEQLAVEVVAAEGESATQEVLVRLQPSYEVAGGKVDLVLSAPLTP